MFRYALIAGVVIALAVAALLWTGKRDEPQVKANAPAHQGPRAAIKRVPCKLKFGPLAPALEVDLSEVRKLGLDARELYEEIVRGEPGATPPAPESPAVMVVNKRVNRITYFQLHPNVKEVRLRTQDAKQVELVVKNQEPLRIELWVDTDQPVDLDVESKESQIPQPGS